MASSIFSKWIETQQQPGRVYIIPHRIGVAYGALVFCLFTVAATYSMTELYAYATILATVGIMTMFLSNNNLKELEVIEHSKAVFVAQHSSASTTFLMLNKSKDDKYLIDLAWQRRQKASGFLAQLRTQQTHGQSIMLPTSARGSVTLDKICLSSNYPLGFFYTWTSLQLQLEVYVYPRPEGISYFNRQGGFGDHLGRDRRPQIQDDFVGLEPYREGASERHIHWKGVAKGLGRLVKVFESAGGSDFEIRLQDVPPGALEKQLRQLSFWVHEAQELGRRFSLELDHVFIPIGTGQEHFHRCLAALATFRSST